MNTENYEVLIEMLDETYQEYQEIQRKIELNLFKIEEAKLYLKSIFDKEDNDFKVFSPRNAEVIHKDEIYKVNVEMDFYEKDNERLKILSDKMNLKIKKIENVLNDDYRVRFLQIQEDERHRISRELHDTSLQNLTHLVHKIELSSMFIDKDPIRAKLELSIVNKNLKSIIEEIRNTIFNLRPMEFDDLGIKAAFERLISIFNKEKKYEIDFFVEDVSCENNIILLTLYRTVQECFNNIIKHADATKIFFHAKHNNGKYCIIIEDNGKGFTFEEIEEKKTSHFGISLIKERISILKGKVNIHSNENGTRIEIEIPMKENLIIS